MNSCSYWTAGHITTFFKIADQSSNILQKGSCGAGFNIKRGVITNVEKINNSKTEIYFENRKQTSGSAGITESILTELEMAGYSIPPLAINHSFQTPIGAGYGTSAAGALSAVFAINDLLELNIPSLQLWQIAHKAEIKNKTGLGDILGLYSQSKFEIRIQEGSPGIGEVINPDFDISAYDLYTLSFGPLSKKDILTNPIKRAKITEIGSECLKKLLSDPSFDNFCNLSLEFAQSIELLSENLWKLIKAVPKSIRASQIMLGDSIYFFVPKNILLPHSNSFMPIKEELTEKVLLKLS